jgi:general secretion pathway protein F
LAAFSYSAVDANGRTTKGIIEAASASAARQALRARALLPVAVEPTTTGSRSGSPLARQKGSISSRSLALVTRQLATLVGAGVRVEDALRTVADQASSARIASLLLNLRSSILDGRSFAAALADYPHVFGDFYRASVAAGEASGQLGQVMEHLASFVETQARNRQTVQLALLYPAILAAVSLAIVIGLLNFVVPDIIRVFSARGAELPFLTRSLIGLSSFVQASGLTVVTLLAGLTLGGLWLLRRPGPRQSWHRWLAQSRLTRGFVLKANAAQFAGTLATLTVSRVPLMEALTASARTVPNLHVRDKVEAAASRVREGTALSVALADAKVFPPMLIAMVASGEAGGVLGQTLSRAAEDQARDLNALVATLVALVEPAVLLLMGGIVMLLVLAILLPIVNLNNLTL